MTFSGRGAKGFQPSRSFFSTICFCSKHICKKLFFLSFCVLQLDQHYLPQVPCSAPDLRDLCSRHLPRSRLCHAQLLTGEINGIANQKGNKEQHYKYNHNVNVLLNFQKNEDENAKTEAHKFSSWWFYQTPRIALFVGSSVHPSVHPSVRYRKISHHRFMHYTCLLQNQGPA